MSVVSSPHIARVPALPSRAMTRRRFLAALAATGVPSSRAWASDHAGRRDHLVAAWEMAGESQVGLLSVEGRHSVTARIAASVDLPTRPHAIVQVSSGSVLVVARRPGDWMLRVVVDARRQRLRAAQWQWIEPARSFNGHAIATPDGTRILTTENDLDTGAGLIGVRDATTLEKLAEWPTLGRDPHELVWMEAAGRLRLAVANGGIATLAETGRVKHDLPAMDPSLALIDPATGAVSGQWRLPDSRLGTRHLAYRDGTLAIALQAEHDEGNARARAPILALFDGERLVTMPAPRPLAGYGGSIIATAQGFVVSCPRAGGVARFDARGAWTEFTPLPDACPLAFAHGELFIGGGSTISRNDDATRAEARVARRIAFDNHWIALRDA